MSSRDSTESAYIGVDVGTGSARAGVFDVHGTLLVSAQHAIRMWQEGSDIREQSSEDIWQACCRAVRTAVREAGIPPSRVQGIGFDATCSLVAVSEAGEQVSVSTTGEDERNVIVWMDHRALREADEINAHGHEVLRYVGGRISPEMQPPKLMWLKRNAPQSWRRATYFFDLPDYLTYRATGDRTRSLCTTTCKWTYLGHRVSDGASATDGWADDFWEAVGLGDVVDAGYARIGRHIRPLGEAVGRGLATGAARDLGLKAGTAVGTSAIDAHAGGIGLLGLSDGSGARFNNRLALIGGTSSCHMALAPRPRFIGGIWGPYFSAMVPGYWLNEGGQSATGALIDHVIFSHPKADALRQHASASGRSVYAVLNSVIDEMAQSLPFTASLTRDLHVLPYFHGNRSPRADPTLRGMLVGLQLTDSLEDLARLYLATVQAIAHGTRHIVDTMNENGYAIDTILACGGGAKNSAFLQAHADVTGCRLVLPREPETVLLGSAILGAVAAGAYDTVMDAMASMSTVGTIIAPAEGAPAAFHEAKHRVFLRMYEDQRVYREIICVATTKPEDVHENPV